MRYAFVPAGACNMCGSDSQKVMGRRLNTAQGLRPKTRIGIATTVVKCRDCGLVYANPLPIPEKLEDHYGLVPESYWVSSYFEILPEYFSGEKKRLKEIAPQAKTFLDVGSGVGKTLKTMLNAGYDAYGIEGSRQFYERAVSNLNSNGYRLNHTTFENAEYQAESFDIISFGAVLEHLYDPSAAIEKALRWLTPNGVVHIEVPDANFLFSKLFNLYFWLCRTDFVVNISPMHRPFHLYEFTEKSFRVNGEKLGHKIAWLDRYAGGTVVTPRLSKWFAPVMNMTKTGSGLIFYLQKS